MTFLKFLRVPKIKARTIRDVQIEPLRILFCGSDAFSIVSLQKLHKRHQIDKSSIASIDVVCRPGKSVGRGLKSIRHVPISETAEELGLPLHMIDTFTGWEPPKPQGMPINLIVAVSFGLFVPPRILGAAKYGGLNVHPSMLPDFYGPAPLQHTLLSDTPWMAGVTVQTLHSKHFDQGIKLLQHPYPGLRHDCRSVEELSRKLATPGGNMLVDCIRNHLYLYGSVLPTPNSTTENPEIRQRHAPKITTADRFINWSTWTGKEIRRRHRVLGPLWSLVQFSQTARRIIWSTGVETTFRRPDIDLPIGQPIVTGYPSLSRDVWVRTCDDHVLKIDQITIEGERQAEPWKAATSAKINHPGTLNGDGPLFRAPILPTLPEQYLDHKQSTGRTTHSTPSKEI